MQQLIHHSDAPLTEMKSVEQLPVGHIGAMVDWGKPQGLWFATDRGWADYCKSINRPLGDFRTEIILSPDARILQIGDVAAFDAFAARFGRGNPLDDILADLPMPKVLVSAGAAMLAFPMPRLMDHSAIDWPEIATLYQGIIIHPHLRARHLHFESFWYYCWDVGSGCIWDAGAVAELKQLTPRARRQRS